MPDVPGIGNGSGCCNGGFWEDLWSSQWSDGRSRPKVASRSYAHNFKDLALNSCVATAYQAAEIPLHESDFEKLDLIERLTSDFLASRNG
jgi:hypothetical protein